MRKRRGAAALVACAAAGLMAAGTAGAFGTFSAPTSFEVDNAAQVATGDLNGDGKLDLVATDYYPGGFHGFFYAFGDGNGGFSLPEFVPEPSGVRPTGIAIGKFTGDRRPDVALADFGTSSITIFQLKNGIFEPGPAIPSGQGAFRLATGDFNGDGRTDLASCNLYGSGTPKPVSILLEKRGGGFKAHKDLDGAPDECQGIDVGRVNGDKHLDIVEQSFAGPFAVLLGRGDGTFKPHKDHATLTSNDGSDNIALGDFTGDGRNDVAVASYDEGKLLIYAGHKDGSLGPPKSRSTGDIGPNGLAAADYNRDGKLDLAIGGWTTNELVVLIGKGNGRFKDRARTAPEHDQALSAIAARLNHDKAPDIVIGTKSSLDVFFNANH